MVTSYMRSPEQVVWDFVQEWLRRGEEDLVVAQELMGRDRASYDPVVFHANQAAGEFLKALLIRYQVPFPKSDSIRVLLCLAESKAPNIQESLGVSCEAEIQRPEETRSWNREAAAQALELAMHVHAVVGQRLADYLHVGRPTTDL